MKPPPLRTWMAGAWIATAIAAGRSARGDEPPPVDVKLQTTPRPHRTLTIEWSPVDLIIARLSGSIVVVPGDHHALVLRPFYTWVSTVPYATQIDAEGNTLPYVLDVLSQSFHGYGAELGYRYYLDKGGPRGFFAGPSLLVASITGKAGNGSETPFLDLGAAVDVGYEALVADTIAITLGAGLQYSLPTKSIPTQQWPASIDANEGVRPRVLVSLGYAL